MKTLKQVAIIGMGKTGEATKHFLQQRDVVCHCYDDRWSPNQTDIDWKHLDALIASPGVALWWPVPHPMVQLARVNCVPILNDIDLFQLYSNGANICVTGTNGKSTTVALINFIAEDNGVDCQLGGNFGTPALSLQLAKKYNILELSSYQLESCNILGFDVSIILNITPDHLTRHGGLYGYSAAKQKIFANSPPNAYRVIGVDDPCCASMVDFLSPVNGLPPIKISGHTLISDGIGWDANKLIDNYFNAGYICDCPSQLDGTHNRQNIAAAYAACHYMGISSQQFAKSLKLFPGLAHRQELVKVINNTPYINDSKATNVQSVEQALQRYDNIIWILGGRPKEDGIEKLTSYFHKIKYALLIGEVAEKWSQILALHEIPHQISGVLSLAVQHAHKIAQQNSGSVVLFSPACASFDQFKNFEERGNIFKKLVEDLPC